MSENLDDIIMRHCLITVKAAYDGVMETVTPALAQVEETADALAERVAQLEKIIGSLEHTLQTVLLRTELGSLVKSMPVPSVTIPTDAIRVEPPVINVQQTEQRLKRNRVWRSPAGEMVGTEEEWKE